MWLGIEPTTVCWAQTAANAHPCWPAAAGGVAPSTRRLRQSPRRSPSTPRPARRPKDLELVVEGKFRKAAARLIRPPLRSRHCAFVHVDAQPMARACCTEGVKRAADSRHISGEDTVVSPHARGCIPEESLPKFCAWPARREAALGDRPAAPPLPTGFHAPRTVECYGEHSRGVGKPLSHGAQERVPGDGVKGVVDIHL